MSKTRTTRFREIHEYGFGIKPLVFWRAWVTASFISLVFILVFGLTLWGFYSLSVLTCNQAGTQLELESKYRFPSGCYFHVDGEWIPSRAFRATTDIDR